MALLHFMHGHVAGGSEDEMRVVRISVIPVAGNERDFHAMHLHRADFDLQLPPIAGSRALLKARLADAAAASKTRPWSERLRFFGWEKAWAYALVALLMGGGLSVALRDSR